MTCPRPKDGEGLSRRPNWIDVWPTARHARAPYGHTDPLRIARRAWTCPSNSHSTNTIQSAAPVRLISRPDHPTPRCLKIAVVKLDLCALALLARVVFLGISLWTYDATDPPSTLVWPASETRSQFVRPGRCARCPLLVREPGHRRLLPGSLARRAHVFSAAYGGRSISPLLRAVGWAISVVGLTTLAALAMPNWTPGPVVGAGGYIGAMGRSLLETQFAQAGAYIFAFSVLLAGLLAVDRLFHVPRRRGHHDRHRPHAAARRPPGPRGHEKDARVKSDLDEAEARRRRRGHFSGRR